jgi:NAD(P)-dependent dehydrogenase (short-subunit alcohol dehydrogenase family)
LSLSADVARHGSLLRQATTPQSHSLRCARMHDPLDSPIWVPWLHAPMSSTSAAGTSADGTSAVVTGAARGIGRAIAVELVRLGHAVVVTDVDAEAVRRTAEEIGAVAAVAQDVRDPQGHRDVAAAAQRYGRLAVWVNNAGVGHDGGLLELGEDKIRALVEINLLGPIWGSRAALAAFSNQGGNQGGDLINIASLSGHGPVPGLSVYAATKAAVVSLALSLSWETPRNVHVHAVCPDGVATEMVEAMKPDGRAKELVASGGRMLTAEEVARAAVALIGSARVVRTLPGHRGAMMRLSSLAPGLTRRLEPLVRSQGRRALRRP